MKKPDVHILDPGQFNQWDRFVDESPEGDLFCHTWWLEAITPGKFRILVAVEHDKIVAGIPMSFDSNNRVNEPPLTRTLGVLYKPQEGLSRYKQESNRRRWLEALLEEFPLSNFMQMCFHPNFTDWLPFRWKGFRQTTRYTYIIHYDNTNDQSLWKNLNLAQRSKVHKAINHGIRVEKTDDLQLLYHYVTATYNRQGLAFSLPFTEMVRLDKEVRERGNRTILKAVDANGYIYSAGYFIHNKKSAYFLISGSDPANRTLGANSLLIWEAIRYFSDKVGCFNFGGSDIKPIEQHMRGYGGVQTAYFRVYNEALMSEEPGLRFHLRHLAHHFAEIFRILCQRIFRTR
jgi:hypothetical protein